MEIIQKLVVCHRHFDRIWDFIVDKCRSLVEISNEYNESTLILQLLLMTRNISFLRYSYEQQGTLVSALIFP